MPYLPSHEPPRCPGVLAASLSAASARHRPDIARHEATSRRNLDDAGWRAESIRRIVDFSARLHAMMPMDLVRLRQVLAAEGAHDRALRGAMASMNLTFDRALIIIEAFIAGGDCLRRTSPHLRDEVATLNELGLVQVARSEPSSHGPSGLTARGRQLAVYLLYRLSVAATQERSA